MASHRWDERDVSPVAERVRVILENRRLSGVLKISRATPDMLTDAIALHFETYVLGEVIKREVVVREFEGLPVNGYQAWKGYIAPEWWLRRWPVRRHPTRTFRVELERWAMYPRADVPVRPRRLGDPVIIDEVVWEEER